MCHIWPCTMLLLCHGDFNAPVQSSLRVISMWGRRSMLLKTKPEQYSMKLGVCEHKEKVILGGHDAECQCTTSVVR